MLGQVNFSSLRLLKRFIVTCTTTSSRHLLNRATSAMSTTTSSDTSGPSKNSADTASSTQDDQTGASQSNQVESDISTEPSSTMQDDSPRDAKTADSVDRSNGDQATSSDRDSKNEATPEPQEDDLDSVPESQVQPQRPGTFQAFKNFFWRSSSAPSGTHYDRAYWEGLSLDKKREQYRCGDRYVTLDGIRSWEKTASVRQPKEPSPFQPNPFLNAKVSLWKGDITALEIGAIVNAANSSLLGGGGVDGAIHSAASYSLRDECATLNGCMGGEAKLTSGHRLPAKYILHTVGPMNGSEEVLKSCYTDCLDLVEKHQIRSVAFCCIATGVYGFPNKSAAKIALHTVREWLEWDNNADKVDRIIFCVFLPSDTNIYKELLHYYFPLGTVEGEITKTDSRGDNEGPIPQLGRTVTEPTPRSDKQSSVFGVTSSVDKEQGDVSGEERGPPNQDKMGGAESNQEQLGVVEKVGGTEEVGEDESNLDISIDQKVDGADPSQGEVVDSENLEESMYTDSSPAQDESSPEGDKQSPSQLTSKKPKTE